MIVPSMSIAEIRREMNRDLPGVTKAMIRQEKELRQSQAFRFNKDQKFQRDIKSARKNSWIAFHHITSKTCNSRPVVHFPSDDGITVGHVLGDKRLLLISGHFLRRYNERSNLNLVGPEAIIKHYFLENEAFTFASSPEFDSANMNIFSLLKNGVALGFMNEEERFIHFRTYVSLDMLYPKQVKRLQKLMDDTVKDLQRMLMTSSEHTFVHNVYSLKSVGWAGVRKLR